MKTKHEWPTLGIQYINGELKPKNGEEFINCEDVYCLACSASLAEVVKTDMECSKEVVIWAPP
jgi:hypothetical protein